MGIRLANEEITLTLSADQAELTLAALHMLSHLAGGEPDDPDTPLTAEAFELYLQVARQVLGGDGGWQSSAHSKPVAILADQLERDMLAIVHRNYARTKDGFVKK